MSPPEAILCIARDALPAAWLEEMAAIPMTEKAFYDRVPGSAVSFIPRPHAESNPAFKQIIPYLLIRSASGGRFGCYQRKGSEDRLHDLWSIGIGGHVSAVDDPEKSGDLRTIVHHGLCREMSEELLFEPSGEPRFLGLINEEKTSVGSVHLGLVFCLDVDESERLVPGEELFRFRWVTKAELDGLKLEHWSRLALGLTG